MPDWAMGVVLQIPLVSAVAWAFVSGKIHTDAELKRREAENAQALAEWKTLFERERSDRNEAAKRLAEGTEAIRDVMDKVESLTREVIRNGRG